MIKYQVILSNKDGDDLSTITVITPELPHYGYDGALGYGKASRKAYRQALIQAKRRLGLSHVKGKTVETTCGICHVLPSYDLFIRAV